ncbi:MAG: hypothetical protein IMF16_08340 [Proteobacteria bacterium]|nr:hypothetical protein [Pseudomonadota bacterium]
MMSVARPVHTTESNNSEQKRDWAALVFPVLLLLTLCGTLYFWRLGAAPLKDFDEAYYAAGAREMLQRGDLGAPFFNGRPKRATHRGSDRSRPRRNLGRTASTTRGSRAT